MIPTQAVVINLKRRPDRLKAFAQRWSKLEVDLPMTVFQAIDGRETGVPEYWQESAGAYGCYLSHQAVLRQFDGPLLVLEDDAVFAYDFPIVLNAQPEVEWDVFYLGGMRNAFAPSYTKPGVYRTDGVAKTHAYIARNPSSLVSVLDERLDEGQHVDYILRDPRIQKVAAQPFVVGQDAGVSDIMGEPRRIMSFWNTPIQERYRHVARPA